MTGFREGTTALRHALLNDVIYRAAQKWTVLSNDCFP